MALVELEDDESTVFVPRHENSTASAQTPALDACNKKMTAYSVLRMLGGSYAVAAVVWVLFVAVGTLVSPTPAPAAAGAANPASDPDYLACQKAAGDESISACGRAIESGKWNGADLSALYRFRGFARVHDGKHDTDAALNDYGEAIRLDPDNFIAYRLRVDLYITERQYDLAVKEMDRLIELKPTPDNYFQRALAYEAKGDIDGALADINKALSLNPPDNLKPYVYLEARKLIHAESAPHPSPAPAASSARAPAAAAQAVPPAPAQGASRASNTRGADASAEADRHACNEASGDQAIIGCNLAIASGKFAGDALAQLYANRGVEFIHKKNIDDALSDFNQAIKLKPDYAMAYNNRGYAYSAKGDFDRAKADYYKALSLNPSDKVKKEIQAALDKLNAQGSSQIRPR